MSLIPRKEEVGVLVETLERVTEDGHPYWETPEELAKAVLRQSFELIQRRTTVFASWHVAGGSIQVGPFASESDAKRWHARMGGAGTLHALVGPSSFMDVTESGAAVCTCGHALGLHQHTKAYGRCMAGHKTLNGPGCACQGFTKEEAA